MLGSFACLWHVSCCWDGCYCQQVCCAFAQENLWWLLLVFMLTAGFVPCSACFSTSSWNSVKLFSLSVRCGLGPTQFDLFTLISCVLPVLSSPGYWENIRNVHFASIIVSIKMCRSGIPQENWTKCRAAWSESDADHVQRRRLEPECLCTALMWVQGVFWME